MTYITRTDKSTLLQEISDQMDRIQNELASLTMVEMKKRDMKVRSASPRDTKQPWEGYIQFGNI